VIDADLADAVNKVFKTPFSNGTLSRARIPGYTLAGKTGTVPLNKAEWSVGYTPNLVAAAVISFDNNPRFKKYWNGKYSYLRGVRLPHSHRYLSGFGADAGYNMLRPAMQQALADIKDHDQFNEPSQSILAGETKPIPSCSGMGSGSCRAALIQAGFDTYVTNEYSDTVRKGGLIGLTRYGSAPKGSVVGVRVSKGPKPAPEPPTTPTPDPTGRPRR
jgi:membrane peptidoglycan carboxypeptidase